VDVNARAALAAAKLYTDDRDYCLVGLPPDALARVKEILGAGLPAFWAIITDKDEITLLLPFDVWASRAERLTLGRFLARVTPGYRLITLDVVLSPDLVGFLAHITPPLAAAGIPILAFSANARDHVFVPKEHFANAWSVLEGMIAAARDGACPSPHSE
jgi:hypothetical protein